ncbi:MAG: ATP-dependent Clp protease proteolytic subunit [Chthoniobacterales bacterium]
MDKLFPFQFTDTDTDTDTPSTLELPKDAKTEEDDTRTIQLEGSVDRESSMKVIYQMLTFANRSDEPIHLQIFSPGGCVISGLAIIDTMRHIKPPVFTYAIGFAASMGAVILAAGEKNHRYVLPSTSIMIHQPRGIAFGKMEDLRSTIEFQNRLEKMLTQVLSEATGKSHRALRRAVKADNWMSARKAMKFGLVDHILDRFGHKLTGGELRKEKKGKEKKEAK